MQPLIIENPDLQFALQPDGLLWSLDSRQGDLGITADGSSFYCLAQAGSARRTSLHPITGLATERSGPQVIPSPHGPLHQVSVLAGPDASGLRLTVTFALPETQPFLLFNLSLENLSPQPVFVERLNLLSLGQVVNSMGEERPVRIDLGRLPDNARADFTFFSNGWQSWNYTGAYGRGDRFRRTRLGFLSSPLRVNPGTPHPRLPGHFGSDMFGVLGDRTRRSGVLAGFLSQRQHFGSLEARLAGASPALWMWANGDGARLDPGRAVTSDWACLHFLNLDGPDPLAPYLEAVARQNAGIWPGFEAARSTASIPSGWSSWYQFYQNISQEIILENIQAAAQLQPHLPLELIQIDDGYERRVGDWYDFTAGFPQGVAPLAGEIRAAGFTPGLWLAPFIVDPRSRLAAEHPDWLLRGRYQRPVNAGFIWNVATTALDLTHPESLAYAAGVVHTAAHDWGYPYLKLDFLYAAALPGLRRDPTLTRAQVLSGGLHALRQAAGEDTFLLGCGCPLGPAVGLVDAMRIGADVSDRWRPAYHGVEFFFHAEPDYPAARNAIQNSLTRAPLHRRWWINDPDNLLVRPNSLLTLAEIQSLATVIALSGGILLLSDHLPTLPPERLRMARVLAPLIGQRPRVLDLFDSTTPRRLRLDLENVTGAWHLLALFNWEDTGQDMALDLREFDLPVERSYVARSFYDGALHRIEDGRLPAQHIPTHGVLLLAVRAAQPGQPQFLGSDLHISQGQEVTAWEADPGGVRLSIERPGDWRGEITLRLPSRPVTLRLNGAEVGWEEICQGCYRIPAEFHRAANLFVSWG